MKIKLLFFIITFSLFIGNNLFAQYRCIPNFDKVGNPRGIYFASTTVYPSILSYTGSEHWSHAYPIGFPFYFNGNLVSYFKVSSTGVLTFDTTVTSVPILNNLPLPNSLIPTNSISIGGIHAFNTNASVSKILFTSPSPKALCVRFLNFGYSGGYTNWQIILEETTNKIYIVDERSYSCSAKLGVQIDSTNAFTAPDYPPISDIYAYQEHFDNFWTFNPGNPLPADAKVEPSFHYVRINDAPFTVGPKIKNWGTDTIHSLDMSYSVNGGPVISETISGLNIISGYSQLVNFSTLWTPADTGVYIINYSVSGVNRWIDYDTTNNSVNNYVYVSDSIPHRNVMFEEFKESWCLSSGAYDYTYNNLLHANISKVSDIKYEEYTSLDRNYYTDYWAIPNAFQNGNLTRGNYFEGCAWGVTQHVIDSLYNFPGLFYIRPHISVSGYTVSMNGIVKSTVSFQPGTYCKIMLSLVRDTIKGHLGGSPSDTVWTNTSYKLFPDKYGTFIGTPHYGQTDSFNFAYSITDTTVNLNQLHVVAFVQDTLTKEIYQCAQTPNAVNQCNPVHHVNTYNICGGDSVLIQGVWRKPLYQQSYPTVFTGINGCDSLQIDRVIVHNLWSNITTTTYNCGLGISSYTYTPTDSNTFAWYNVTLNQLVASTSTYQPYYPTQSGNYELILSNQMGCIDTSNILSYTYYPLIITPNGPTTCAASGLTLTSNYLHNNIWYGGSSDTTNIFTVTSSGTYNLTHLNPSGCTSYASVHVTLSYINTTITQTPTTLSSVYTSGPTFQWLDCNNSFAIIPGATSRAYTPSVSGNYALQITLGGCLDTTLCYSINLTTTNIQQSAEENGGFVIAPNPFTEQTTLTFNNEQTHLTIKIVDVLGKEIKAINFSGKQLIIEKGEMSNGIYFLQITDQNKNTTNKKIIIQ